MLSFFCLFSFLISLLKSPFIFFPLFNPLSLSYKIPLKSPNTKLSENREESMEHYGTSQIDWNPHQEPYIRNSRCDPMNIWNAIDSIGYTSIPFPSRINPQTLWKTLWTIYMKWYLYSKTILKPFYQLIWPTHTFPSNFPFSCTHVYGNFPLIISTRTTDETTYRYKETYWKIAWWCITPLRTEFQNFKKISSYYRAHHHSLQPPEFNGRKKWEQG